MHLFNIFHYSICKLKKKIETLYQDDDISCGVFCLYYAERRSMGLNSEEFSFKQVIDFYVL